MKKEENLIEDNNKKLEENEEEVSDLEVEIEESSKDWLTEFNVSPVPVEGRKVVLEKVESLENLSENGFENEGDVKRDTGSWNINSVVENVRKGDNVPKYIMGRQNPYAMSRSDVESSFRTSVRVRESDAIMKSPEIRFLDPMSSMSGISFSESIYPERFERTKTREEKEKERDYFVDAGV